MDSQLPSGSESPSDPGTQKRKRNLLSTEQKQVLLECFEKSNYVSREECKSLAQRLGMKQEQIKIYFKNRRARKRFKKSQQLPGKIGSGPHCRPTNPKDAEVSVSDTTIHSVFQRQVDAISPQFRPLRNSPYQESKFSFIDQPFEEVSFSISHVIGEHQSQKCRELPKKPDHQSSDRSGLPSVPSHPDVSGSAEFMCERPSGLCSSLLLRSSSIAGNPDFTFSMCQTPSVLHPLPELSPMSNSLDQMAIFDNIDQACEMYLKNIMSSQPEKQQEDYDIIDYTRPWFLC